MPSTYGRRANPASSLRVANWNYRPEAPYIVAAALLSLRDAGLIRMFVEPGGGFLHTLDRVRVERTDMAVSGELPLIEGSLLGALMSFADRRFGKTEAPAVAALVTEWIHSSKDDPFRWVIEAAVQDGRNLGLYEPVVKRTRLFGRLMRDKPVYSLEHLVACDDQAVACASRWHEFAVTEPDLQQRLITEVSFGIERRQATGGSA